VQKPESVACIIYMMDVSGSMTDEQKEIVRIEAFWIDTWLKAHYQGIKNVYIVHDAEAQRPGAPVGDKPSFIGLSATPFRTDDEESQRLSRRFDSRWLPGGP